MKVEWLQTATDDADDIADRISIDDPVAAAAVLAKIDRAVARLEAFPFIGRSGRIAGTRELVVPRTPYIAIYEVEQNTIFVVNVIHGAWQWPPSDFPERSVKEQTD